MQRRAAEETPHGPWQGQFEWSCTCRRRYPAQAGNTRISAADRIYGSHRFAKRPRWQAHFTPTSASWLINQVERWFGLLTDKQIRRGVHRSTKELERTILDYIDTTNQNPKPFKWTNKCWGIRR